MMRALWTAATGMEAQQLQIDVISNNLANVNTTGFKRGRADFQDLLYQTLQAPGSSGSSGKELPTGIQLGQGVRPVSVQKIFTTGDMQQTQNELDVAIEGDGFFQITRPSGEVAYTRAGAFKKNSEGDLVTSNGYSLEPQIQIPIEAQTVTIGTDGTVSITIAGQVEADEIGTLQLVRFINPAGLKAIGRNMLVPTTASGEPITGVPGEDGFGTLAQGFLEKSNVNLVEEMVGMIVAQRAYEISSKVITTADQMLQSSTRG
jgi:flagellar basal-body rod protein FlgG